jgi:hypothetical protein
VGYAARRRSSPSQLPEPHQLVDLAPSDAEMSRGLCRAQQQTSPCSHLPFREDSDPRRPSRERRIAEIGPWRVAASRLPARSVRARQCRDRARARPLIPITIEPAGLTSPLFTACPVDKLARDRCCPLCIRKIRPVALAVVPGEGDEWNLLGELLPLRRFRRMQCETTLSRETGARVHAIGRRPGGCHEVP